MTEETIYISGDTEYIIESKDSTKDLGVIMQTYASSSLQIKKAVYKACQNAGGWPGFLLQEEVVHAAHVEHSSVPPHGLLETAVGINRRLITRKSCL